MPNVNSDHSPAQGLKIASKQTKTRCSASSVAIAICDLGALQAPMAHARTFSLSGLQNLKTTMSLHEILAPSGELEGARPIVQTSS